jgi:hypothetical protein
MEEGVMTADLFQNVAALTRQQALPGLKARAEAEQKIITVCMYCNAYVSEQDGRGVTGLSHGCCAECEPKMQEDLDVMFGDGFSLAAKREGAEEDAASSHFSEAEERHANVAEPFRSILNGLCPR